MKKNNKTNLSTLNHISSLQTTKEPTALHRIAIHQQKTDNLPSSFSNRTMRTSFGSTAISSVHTQKSMNLRSKFNKTNSKAITLKIDSPTPNCYPKSHKCQNKTISTHSHINTSTPPPTYLSPHKPCPSSNYKKYSIN